jgi:hypothetical protein
VFKVGDYKSALDPLLRSDQLMATGRAALTAGDLDQAIRIFTKVMTLPEHENSREAKELLGVARERNGQLAHAKAEYEEYLKRYPVGDGATRVRQRLDAMLSAGAKPPDRPGAARAAATAPLAAEIFGSACTQYRREVVDSDATGSFVTDSSEYTDLSVSSRARSENVLWRSLMSGSYRFDLVDDADGNETRISAFYLDGAQRSGPYSATLGRQPGNTAGVSSRSTGCASRAGWASSGASRRAAASRSRSRPRTGSRRSATSTA